jgi:CreA protein
MLLRRTAALTRGSAAKVKLEGWLGRRKRWPASYRATVQQHLHWRSRFLERTMTQLMLLIASALAMAALTQPADAQEPDQIFSKSTVWRPLTPDDKLVVYGIDDPAVDGVACHYTTPERGGIKGTLGVAEEVSDISLACRQIGPVRFKEKFEQGAVVFSERRSLIFKRMRIVRGCDAKRNVLVYMVFSDRPIEGSPKNSTSSVPLMPWGGGDAPPRCADWVTK